MSKSHLNSALGLLALPIGGYQVTPLDLMSASRAHPGHYGLAWFKSDQ